ncbi:beta strand repeat-containing protein [Nakamurella sp. GG22]
MSVIVSSSKRTATLAVATLLVMSLAPVVADDALAVPITSTLLFSQPFLDNTPLSADPVVLPAPASVGSNSACLTATGNTTTGVLKSCPAASGYPADTSGSGALALTPTTANQAGGVFAATSVPTSQAIDITFTMNQYGSTAGADGMVLTLSAVNPANPTAPPTIGPTGGSLGYAAAYGNVRGLANAYLGIGFDVFGNFSSSTSQGTGCATDSTFVKLNGKVPGQVLVRGPGNGVVGYCGLNGTGATASTAVQTVVPMHGATRAASAVPVEVVVNPRTVAVTSGGGISVPAQSYLVVFTPIGGSQRTLTGLLPTMLSSMVGAPSWLDSNGFPKQLAFGWVASTGSVTDNHEVRNVVVKALGVVPEMTVSQANYTPAAATPTTALPIGSPVSYVVTPGVATGVAESGTISVTETVPSGVTPLAGSGTNAVCGSPVGQSVTCSNSNGPFVAGSSLPAVTISAVVTGSNVSQTTVQSAVVTASSDGGQAAYSAASPTNVNPSAPAVTALSPASGLVAGGNTVTISGTGLTGATSIQIGTDAELAAGTGTTLVPCATVAAPGCFTVSGSTLVISSMPAHAVAAVTVKVINLGASGSATYNYMTVPVTPVVTATAGVTSAVVTWSGTDGGSPITGYTVTPYRNGVAQSDVRTPAAGVSTATFTGLTAGGTYTFRVVAANANGSSLTGVSNAVVPYTIPTAPLTPTVAASTGQAIVSWTAPTNTGSSPITGYIVTPYLGVVAQAPQTFASAALSQTVTALTANSSYTFTVKATNAAGTGPASVATAAVTINPLPTIALPIPVTGEVGAAYSNPAFTVTGGTGPFVWSIAGGALPTGLALGSAGAITGTPTAAGTTSFTVKVTDAAGTFTTQALTLAITPAPVLANPAAPAGQVGVAYSDQLVVQTDTGTGPFGWVVSAGALPAGLTIAAATGLISGTPTTAGTAVFTVQVTDAQGQKATQSLSITVTASPSLSFPAPAGGQVGVIYSNPLVVTGGTGPFTWSVTGSLPPGLALGATTGLLSGTPTTAGTFPVTIRVQDSRGQSASQAVTLAIAAVPALTFTPPAGEVGAVYSAQPVRTGGTGPFVFTVSSGTLPAGVVLNPATGELTGTPSVAGDFAVTLGTTDSFGQSVTAGGTILIAPAPTLTLPPPAVGDVGRAYVQQFTVNGGTGPYAWTLSAGVLPDGLSLDPATGAVSGTPTTGGTSAVTVRVTDAFGRSATQAVTILIRAASTVALVSSPGAVTPGGAVVLTATVGPIGITGTVTFTDSITSGPMSGTSTVVGSVAVGPDGKATVTFAPSAFGAHEIVARYGGDATNGARAGDSVVVEVVATPGSVLVGEFRLSGPSGPGDEYVELANVSPDPVALAGFQVVSSSGVTTTLPEDSPILPVGRSYLLTGPDFSLGGTAHSDHTAAVDLGAGGVAVKAPDSARTATDAVGPNVSGYHLGTPLPAFGGTPTAQYAWVRTQPTSYLQNTQDNAADFALVSSSGALVGGLQSMLGSASPTGLTDPWQHTFVVRSALLSPAVAAGNAPNRVVVKLQPGVPGSLTVRRVLTNTTADTVTTMKVRLHTLSQANGILAGAPLSGPYAELRAVNPATETTVVSVAGVPVTVQNLRVNAPVVPASGGGLNSTLAVPLPPGGLGPDESVSVAFTFAADKGGTFWFGYDVDTAGLG